MKDILNVHVYPSSMTHESRIYKQANSIRKLNAFDQIWLIGILDDDLLEEEILNENIIIKRINVKFFASSARNNLLTYFIFYVKVFWMLLFRKLGMLNVHNVELLPLGVVLKFLKRCVLIYDPHELETEKSSAGLTRRKILRALEKRFISYVDKVFVVGEAIADYYVKLYQCEKPVVILNCPNLLEVGSSDYFRDKFNIPSKATIYLCQGRLAKYRGIEMIIDAFSRIHDMSKSIVFMGDGDLTEYVKNVSQKSNNIFYHPAVQPDILLDYTASADVGLALIEDISLSYRFCMPNKIFEYLMAGLPIVVSDLPEMTKVVESFKVGRILRAYTSESLHELIMMTDFSEIDASDIRGASVRYYNWEAQEKIMLQEYRSILK